MDVVSAFTKRGGVVVRLRVSRDIRALVPEFMDGVHIPLDDWEILLSRGLTLTITGVDRSGPKPILDAVVSNTVSKPLSKNEDDLEEITVEITETNPRSRFVYYPGDLKPV